MKAGDNQCMQMPTSSSSSSISSLSTAWSIQGLVTTASNAFEAVIDKAVTLNVVPDPIVRRVIRLLLAQRLKEYSNKGLSSQMVYKMDFIEQLKLLPVAVLPEKANEQHYEVPPRFFELVLGQCLKYSCCFYSAFTTTLDEAELAMMNLYCERAEIQDGMTVLDLGCGWGSFSLLAAAKYPNCKIIGVSNSAPQKTFIDAQAIQRGLRNVEIVTCDINSFTPPPPYLRKIDRVVSIEMFEHMKNYEVLLKRVSSWLRPGGEARVFVHIFCHREYPYHFEGKSWMAKHFFSGGTMPSEDLLLRFAGHLLVQQQWRVEGTQYARTCRDWLRKMDKNIKEIRQLFVETYGFSEATRWVAMWRTFFMACEEMFAFDGGRQWFVAHYLFAPQDSSNVDAFS